MSLIWERIQPYPGLVVGGDEFGFEALIGAHGIERWDWLASAGQVAEMAEVNVAAFSSGGADPVFDGRGDISVSDRRVMGLLRLPRRSEIDDLTDLMVECDDEEWLDEIVAFALPGEHVAQIVRGVGRSRFRRTLQVLQLEFPPSAGDEVFRLHLERFDEPARKGRRQVGLEFSDKALGAIATAHMLAPYAGSRDSDRLARILRAPTWDLLRDHSGLRYEAVDIAAAAVS